MFRPSVSSLKNSGFTPSSLFRPALRAAPLQGVPRGVAWDDLQNMGIIPGDSYDMRQIYVRWEMISLMAYH